MRLALALALLALASPFAAADFAVTVPGSVIVGVTVDPTTVATTHTSSSQDPPCASTARSDRVAVTGGVANERARVEAAQERWTYDCGVRGDGEAFWVSAERRTGDASTYPFYISQYDTDADNGSWCGTSASVASINTSPGCIPASQRPPYVLHLLP